MTDDLTPEEKEALRNLPRERMPVGLEGRVVDAMRARGFLAKKRRTITLTSGRVAGVLAASVALVIAAYSIGLQRGGDRTVPRLATVERYDGGRLETQVMDARDKKAAHSPGAASSPTPEENGEAHRTALPEGQEAERKAERAEEPVASDAARREVPEAPPEGGRPTAESPVPSGEAHNDFVAENEAAAGSDAGTRPETTEERASRAGADAEATVEVSADRVEKITAKAIPRPDPTATPPAQPQMPKAALEESASSLRAEEPPTAKLLSRQPLTYRLNGSTVVVEAPDSVRITQDDRGRMLVIYTSDGIIRIRLADE